MNGLIKEKLKKELKTFDQLCKKIWDERYNDAKHQDTWYDSLWEEYRECSIKIKTYVELITSTTPEE